MARNNAQKPKLQLNYKLILVLVVLVLGGLYIYSLRDKMGAGIIGSSGSGASFAPSGIELNYDYSANLYCYANNNGFFFCTKDGIKFISTAGDIKWDYPLTMNEPVMAGEGAYAAVAEGGGKFLYVFSEDGLVHTQEFDASETINSFAVNTMGYTSVILQSDQDYRVRGFNGRGGRVIDQVYTDDNIYPFTTDISDDSRMIAIGLLKVNGLHMSSDINFHYLDAEEGSNYSDGMFASVTSFDGQLVAKVKFMAGNVLLAITDTHVSGISTSGSTLGKIFDHEIGNQIDFVAFPSENSFVLAAGEPMVNKEGYGEGDILFYDVDGRLVSRHSTESKITALSGGVGGVLAGYGNMGRTFTAFNDKGLIQWRYTVTQDVNQMHFLGKLDRIIFISPLKLQVLERTKSPARQESLPAEESSDEMLPGMDPAAETPGPDPEDQDGEAFQDGFSDPADAALDGEPDPTEPVSGEEPVMDGA